MRKKILVVRFGSLGDVVLTSATVLNLHLNNPGSHLVFLTKERFRPVVECFDGVDEIRTVPDHASARELFSTLTELDKTGFDLIVDLHGNFRSWCVRKLLTANTRLVYPRRRGERRQAVRKKIFPAEYPHTIDLYNDVLRQIGQSVFCRRPVMHVGTLPDEISDEFFAAHRVVVIAPGAAHAVKQWPPERFAAVAEELNSSHGIRIIRALTAADAHAVAWTGSLPEEDVIQLVDCPIDKLAAVMARADLTLANDSGVAHLSSAVGTPVLAVFGPTHPVLGFAPRGLHDRIIEVDEACRPCSLHGEGPCIRDERYCLTGITPEDVVRTIEEMLAATKDNSPALIADRDGTIIADKYFLSDPDQVELIPGSAEALRRAKAAGYKIVIVSNQSGVARGLFGIEDVERVNGRLLEILAREKVEVDGLYYCPYHSRGRVTEFARESGSRKPAAGMAEAAALDLGIDLRRSLVVGDSLVDAYLGRVIGAESCLVRTGYGPKMIQQLIESGRGGEQLVFDNLLAAVECRIEHAGVG